MKIAKPHHRYGKVFFFTYQGGYERLLVKTNSRNKKSDTERNIERGSKAIHQNTDVTDRNTTDIALPYFIQIAEEHVFLTLSLLRKLLIEIP